MQSHREQHSRFDLIPIREIPQHISIRLYWFNCSINPTIKSNNQIKIPSEDVIAERNTKHQPKD